MCKKLFLSFIVIALASCSNAIQEDLTIKMAETQKMPTTDTHVVSYSDIVALSKAENNSTRASSNAIAKIECITGKANDTLLYVCQKQEGGWTVYSSDTRVPAIVAQSDEGSFDELMQICGAKLWIQSMADDMAAIRQLTDDKLNFSPEEIEKNKSFWEAVSSPDEFVKKMQKNSGTRGGELDPNLEPDSILQNGLWVLRESYTYTEFYDSISRLTQTIWKQRYPYNNFCPARTDTTYYNAPAGCVAIAGAQMLYFLHYKLGKPETAPTHATCYGNINNYTMNQDNFTTTVWDSMNIDGYQYKAAPLVANVGTLVGMDYGNSSSGADTEDLVNYVFRDWYGISCAYDEYSTGTLRTSLLSGMPVILRAKSSTVGGRHAFIIDQYMRTRTVTANYYTWVYDNLTPPYTPMPAIPEYVEYVYSSPVISMIRMNWGWGGKCNNDWFSLTGDWFAGSKGGVFYNWNDSRHMIYGFSPIY